MAKERREKCFVVMPFGVKPFREEPGRTYDFDKVYRVIIRRAILESGLEPVRADEEAGSHIIHTGMFRELRDRPVVLADLSLENPNVFYELGIRHVMAATGTVLICRQGQTLPFDVKMSRVIPYAFDGHHLDWEEVERVIPQIRSALREAGGAAPDSPVHSLLDHVLQPARTATPERGENPEPQPGTLDRYQRLIAAHWGGEAGDRGIDERLREEEDSIFGVRTVAHLCLATNPLPKEAPDVATRLYHMEQYDLALPLYEAADADGGLSAGESLRYASAMSESDRTVGGASRARERIRDTLAEVERTVEENPEDARALTGLVRCWHSLSGIQIRLWRLTKSEEDLHAALGTLGAQAEIIGKALAGGHEFELGLIALMHLRLMLLLRESGDEDEAVERHRDAVLKLQAGPRTDARSRSYLRWYQAIAMADAGDERAVEEAISLALSQDTQARQHAPNRADIGRRQYTHLRRLIQDNAHQFRNPTLVDRISRTLRVLQSQGGA